MTSPKFYDEPEIPEVLDIEPEELPVRTPGSHFMTVEQLRSRWRANLEDDAAAADDATWD